MTIQIINESDINKSWEDIIMANDNTAIKTANTNALESVDLK